jgi:hypothetical protein
VPILSLTLAYTRLPHASLPLPTAPTPPGFKQARKVEERIQDEMKKELAQEVCVSLIPVFTRFVRVLR